jgi:lactate dehydrogenase-like 2-hydroxyacid dehydrogenase
MLLNITYIDDLPEVKAMLLEASVKMNIDYFEKINPSRKQIFEYSDIVRSIFCNPNKIAFKFDNEFFETFKNLKVLCTASTGTVHIDLDAARSHGVKVISIKTEMDVLKNVTSTADLALTLALTGIRKSFESSNDFFNQGMWDFERYIGKQVKDLRVCVFGYGRLGKMFAKYLSDLGAFVKIVDPNLSLDFETTIENIYSQLHEFDLISLHVHAEGNQGFFSDEFFKKLRDDVVLVNTSRGEIIDQLACFRFLRENPAARYMTDVIENEHSKESRNLFIDFYNKNHNLIVTQHIGGMSTGARKLAFGKAAEKLLEIVKNDE